MKHGAKIIALFLIPMKVELRVLCEVIVITLFIYTFVYYQATLQYFKVLINYFVHTSMN